MTIWSGSSLIHILVMLLFSSTAQRTWLFLKFVYELLDIICKEQKYSSNLPVKTNYNDRNDYQITRL